MEFVNLTPHSITIIRPFGGNIVVPPSGQVARCAEMRQARPALQGGVPVSLAKFGEVEGLPAPEAGKSYIVSAIVLSAVPSRGDVFAPGKLVRDGAGQPVGCEGLSCTPAYGLTGVKMGEGPQRLIDAAKLAAMEDYKLSFAFEQFCYKFSKTADETVVLVEAARAARAAEKAAQAEKNARAAESREKAIAVQSEKIAQFEALQALRAAAANNKHVLDEGAFDEQYAPLVRHFSPSAKDHAADRRAELRGQLE